MTVSQRIVLGLWLAFGLFVSGRTILRPHSHTVFPVYVATVEQWWNGDNIYLKSGDLDYFRYPPIAAVLLTPFGLLGPVWGGVLWIWTGLAIYGSGLRRLQRDVLPGEWKPDRQSWFFALALIGAASGLMNGQSNAIIAGLMLHGCAALARGRWWTAAFWLGGAVGLKMLPLPIVLLCGVRWPRLIPRLVVVVAISLVLPFLTASPEYVLAMYRAMAEQGSSLAGERWPGFRDGWMVWLIVSEGGWSHLPNLRQPIDSVTYRVLQLAMAVGAFLVIWWKPRHTAALDVTMILGLGGGWLMLFGPASEHPTFVFLAPLLAWAYAQRKSLTPGNPLATTAALLAFGGTWLGPMLGLATTVPWLLLALPFGCALFVVWLLLWQTTTAMQKRCTITPERTTMTGSLQ